MRDDGILTLTDGNWDADVPASPVPLLVGFWAEWCIPSRTLSAFEAAARLYAGRLRVGRVNAEENPGLVARYGIRGLPTLLLLREGKAEARRVGLMARDDLLKLLEQQRL